MDTGKECKPADWLTSYYHNLESGFAGFEQGWHQQKWKREDEGRRNTAG